MIDHGYSYKQTDNELVNQNLLEINKALGIIAGAIKPTQLLSFVSLGNNGGGYVGLVPPKLSDGTTPLYRASAGMKLVLAIDLTTLASKQTSFEQVLASNDQIKQISSANLSADTILFIVQG